MEELFDCDPGDGLEGAGAGVDVCEDCGAGVCAGGSELLAAFPPHPSVDKSNNAGAHKYATG